MPMKYSNYIQLSPNYESVVDLGADERNPNLWQEYIVHDDMKKTVEAICQTMEFEDNDKRRSFWIHGAYGTGKSYAAIVLKHLFEDKLSSIECFLSKTGLAPFKKRFLKVREKGEYLVAWKNGATGVKNGTHLMMEMEVIIRKKLAEKFGDKAYYGQRSLINAAKDAVADQSIDWQFLFNDHRYGLSDKNNSLEEFRQKVLDGNFDAMCLVERICRDNNRTMFTGVVDRFEEWIKDIIDGNGIKETGIVFIWDEFTGFLRDSGDDNVLQRLSEFCKSVDKDGKAKPSAPFFMCLIVHRDPTWVDQLGNDTYYRILHRYHDLEFHITESAAYDLIGDSIKTCPGMDQQWDDEKKRLLKDIEKYKTEFDNLEQKTNIFERMNKLCPLHPMTVSMLATVAQNFGASQRTLFCFMKDKDNVSENVGFVHYINNNGPYDWYWLTADYLWDYFFIRESDVRNFNADTRKIIQHFQKVDEQSLISSDGSKHVFKAAMLLIAIVGNTSVSNRYSQQHTRNKIAATKKTLYKLFRGLLKEEQIDEYLTSYEQIGVLRLDVHQPGDARLELPYTGSYDIFDGKLSDIKKRFSRYQLFAKNKSPQSLEGVFSKTMEGFLWDEEKATYKRMFIAVCSSETNSLNIRLGEVKAELNKSPYKIGLLVVAISAESEFKASLSQIEKKAAEDNSKRLVIAMLKEPCTDEIIDRWHRAITNKELSANEGKKSSESKYENEAFAEVVKWCATASEGQIFACYGEIKFPSLYGKRDLIKQIENNVLYSVFSAAPEKIIGANTAFKKGNGAAIVGLSKTDAKNNQVNQIINALKAVNAWNIDDLDALVNLQGNNVTAVTELAKFIKGEFEQGAKISLDKLWAALQQPPFGYYNSLTAEVFLGLVLRFFVKGSPRALFNWLDSQNNTNEPTAQNLASMINKMMNGGTLNNYLLSGSAVWQKFKPYAKDVFGLNDSKCVSEAETRKFATVKIIEIGVPFWSLKYVSAEKLGGSEAKVNIEKLTDAFCDFIYKMSEDQERVMETVLEFFHGRGQLRKVMAETIVDKNTMYMAFKHFIFTESTEIKTLYGALSLTDKDLFDSISGYLQRAINTWLENEVRAKLPELATELSVISTLNTALGITVKTYKSVQEILKNKFENMPIPGEVVETLSYSWIPAMKLLRRISTTPWQEMAEISGLLDTLRVYAKPAWDILSHPKRILETIISKRNISYSDEEIDAIYTPFRSKPMPYETKVEVFNDALDKQLDNISSCRNIADIKRLWNEKTKTKDIRDWCNKENCPIVWLFDGLDSTNIATIVAVYDDKQLDRNALECALIFMQNNNLAILSDKKAIADSFFANIGETYREAFQTYSDTLYARLKTSDTLLSDVYSWSEKVPQIRKILDEFLRDKHVEEAKKSISSMSIDELRSVVCELLDKMPQLSTRFLKK